jgi:hypothetical protein
MFLSSSTIRIRSAVADGKAADCRVRIGLRGVPDFRQAEPGTRHELKTRTYDVGNILNDVGASIHHYEMIRSRGRSVNGVF